MICEAFNKHAQICAILDKPTALAVARWEPSAPRLAARSYLFWTLVKWALEET
jgi:hypothetical protein